MKRNLFITLDGLCCVEKRIDEPLLEINRIAKYHFSAFEEGQILESEIPKGSIRNYVFVGRVKDIFIYEEQS